MTATMLSRRLKELECHGLVERRVLDRTPPGNRYELTDAGREVARLLGRMEDLVQLEDVSARTDCSDGCWDDSDSVCVSSGPVDTCITISV